MPGWKFIIASVLLFICLRNSGQPVAPALATPVTVDLVKQTLTDIPFDKPFYFLGDATNAVGVQTIIFEIKRGRGSKGVYIPIGTSTVRGSQQFICLFLHGTLGIDFLLPDHEYTIRITSQNAAGANLPDYSFEYGLLITSKFGDHTKLDFGIGWAPSPNALFGYTSVNIYFTPINDETNLKEIQSLSRNLFLRTSLFMGISPILFSSDTKQPIKNKYGAGNFVFGIGIRSPFYGRYTPWFRGKVGQKLLQPMRISIGEFLYKQANANSVINADVNKHSPFVAITYDWNIATLLGPVGKIFSP
ncbi:MAG TPA: hypothetical protein VGM41_00010 [Chitinophagaceae bacterium]|jgi:hypothetical protein